MQFKLEYPKKRGERVIIPIPQTNSYQNIIHLHIQPVKYKIVREKIWGNQAAVFTLNDVSNSMLLSFKHHGKSIKKTLNRNIRIQNYGSDSIRKYEYLLLPNRFVHGEDDRVQKIVKDLRLKDKNLSEVFADINHFVLDYLSYGKPIEGLYPYTQAIEERVTDCGGFSTLTLSLLQALKIPARLVVGFIINRSFISKILSHSMVYCLNSNVLNMHVWPEVILPDGTLFPFDPALEWRRTHNLTHRNGGLGYIPDDRLVLSYGQDFVLPVGKKSVQLDILQHPLYSNSL